jgi:two-component system cell cycle sensor histidine kinase/response regulator CckA
VEERPADRDIRSAHPLLSGTPRFEVEQAESVERAQQSLRDHVPDAIIVDLPLTDSSNLETIDQLRRLARHAPILVLTEGPGTPELRHLALSAGATDLIEKASATPQIVARSLLHAIEQGRGDRELARLNRIIDTNPEAMLVVDEMGTTLFANAAAESLLGRRKAELLGHRAKFPLDDAGPVDIELVIRGTRREVELRVVPIDWEGQRCAFATLRDVTEQRATRERRRRAQELEAVGRLAGGIAHDFNNLLTGIMTFTSLVRETIGAGDSRRDDLGQVLNAGKRAVELTRQLLAFSLKEPSAPRPVDLNELLRDLTPRIRAAAGPRVQITARLSSEPCPVLIDPERFAQILNILVNNSSDAMPEGGTVTIETFSGEDVVLGTCVVCRVADDGVGMTEEVQRHIFQPFYTTKSLGEGTGMGLATAYGMLLQANGAVEVQSSPGSGARFDLRFPRLEAGYRAPRSTTPPPQRLPLAKGGETILIAEDDPLVRQSVVRMLRRGGYKFFEATTGLAACEIFAKRKDEIHLALLDVVMPELSGPETALWLRRENPSVKILFMSGYPRDFFDANAEARQLGPLIQKPMTEDVLLTVVRRVLDGHDEHATERLT